MAAFKRLVIEQKENEERGALAQCIEDMREAMDNGDTESVRGILFGDVMRDAETAAHSQVGAMRGALQQAAELVKIARHRFPKSMRNRDRFQLENTCASINGALLGKVQS